MNELRDLEQIWTTIDWISWGSKGLRIIFILLIAKILLTVISHIVDRSLLHKKSENYFWEDRKAKTIGALLKSLARYGIYAIAAVTVLSEFGINTSALLTGAGVLGLAVGFGAQGLVKDIITGFFILFEDQFTVGDYIETPQASGTVEALGLRITKIRAVNGGLHILPNSEIRILTNFNRGHAQALVDVELVYGQDTELVNRLLTQIAEEVYAEKSDLILSEPQVLGITSFGQGGMVFRVVAQTQPMQHWYIERVLRLRIETIFADQGIEIANYRSLFQKG